MKLKSLCIAILTAFASAATAQVNLYSGSEVIAHDVKVGAQMPEALRLMLEGRQLDSKKAQQADNADNGSARKPLARRLRNARKPKAPRRVEPLLQSISGQDEPYNWLCPYALQADGTPYSFRCVAGCVATSIEQILAYYRYPTELQDTLFGWSTDQYTIADLLPGTRFDWDNHLNDYRKGYNEQQGQAVALPMLASGMAVHMRYGPYSSGANTYLAVEPLQRAFGYGMARWLDRVMYTPDNWHAILQYELEQSRPIAYVGHNMEMSGHAFNIDGVDEQGFYHINWAYDGNYDGWYDLDWLNPWEPTDAKPDGIAYGFFSNQGALVMHPSADAKPLEPDTLDIDELGVELTKVEFLRPPENVGYVATDFYFSNNGSNDVTYTYEIFTYLPTDTAIFHQADYIGISAINIPAGEKRRQRVYLMFHTLGERIMGISHDDVTIPFSTPVTVAQGKNQWTRWENLTYELEPTNSGCDALFTVDVTNLNAGTYASDIIFFCLYPEGKDGEDTRHYDVLDLKPGEQQTLSVRFRDLEPSTHYHFLVRCPWAIRQQVEFDTPAATAITAPLSAPEAKSSFDIAGRPWNKASRGIIISDRKKWLKQ